MIKALASDNDEEDKIMGYDLCVIKHAREWVQKYLMLPKKAR